MRPVHTVVMKPAVKMRTSATVRVIVARLLHLRQTATSVSGLDIRLIKLLMSNVKT